MKDTYEEQSMIIILVFLSGIIYVNIRCIMLALSPLQYPVGTMQISFKWYS